jgi:hypothetical protein
MSDSHDFCRLLLSVTRKELTTEQRKLVVGAWSYTYSNGSVVDSGEFQIPKAEYYWHGSCCCAYSARTNGINAWLQEFYPEEKES